MDFQGQSSNSILETRHKSEEQYHDLKNLAKITTPKHYMFHPTYRVFQNMKQRMNLTPEDTILEFGCGSGWITAEMAETGATVDAFDISGEAVDKTKTFLKRLNLDINCNVRKMAAERLDYPDNHYNYVIGFAILHHLNLEMALPEVHRVLKAGGTAFFAEPLGENPLLNIYRKLTPRFRTADEKPLMLNKFKNEVAFFSTYTHEEFFLTALIPIAVSYVPYANKYFDSLLNTFMRLDKFILSKFPSLGRWAWYSIIELRK